MKNYDHKKIELKWQKEWEKKKVYKTLDFSKRPKYYILDMFPYLSGEGLHVGHPKGYIATDIISRMKRMQGFNVMHPIGFDAFGLPAENYAIKTKTNPAVSVPKNVARFKKQFKILGFDYDWSREINTTDPKFYKWTQWIFLKLFEKGLAYESYEPINWCPSCKTGLANEDVEDDKCERCGTLVEQKPMRQWVLRITDYAERLLKDLDSLDWAESIKESQRNWIGKSEGSEIDFKIKNSNEKIKVFTTRADTIFGATYVVLAPEHSLVESLKLKVESEQNKKEIEEYIKKTKNKSDLERAENKEKTGVEVKGIKAINPANGEEIPIWIADYVLASYGTGAVMAVPAHDERDFEFAKKYNLKFKFIIKPYIISGADNELDLEKIKLKNSIYINDLINGIRNPVKWENSFSDYHTGVLINSDEFNGLKSIEAIKEITEFVRGKMVTKYKLRDWVFSRQRYWGEPIPVLHDGDKIIPVKEKDLPVILPRVKSYEPTGTGESPLANIPNWVNIKVGKGKNAKIVKRETNTMPQWAGSSWYYLRYMDPNNNKILVDKKKEKYWNQVDFYVGGAEHATRHLIYARFWHKFLYDIGSVSTIEPFKKLQSVGLIIGEDGKKMSKRFGNIVNPDEIVKTYGADTLRLYEMFMGPFDQMVVWNTSSIIGPRRFLEKVWKLGEKIIKNYELGIKNENSNENFTTLLHKTIKKVSEDIEAMHFNTAISAMMIFANEVEKNNFQLSTFNFQLFLKILAPFAPHITEDLWQALGEKGSIHFSKWPKWDEEKIKEDAVKIVIQVNGKVRTEMMIKIEEKEEEIKEKALSNEIVLKFTLDKEVKKIIYVKNKLINIVV